LPVSFVRLHPREIGEIDTIITIMASPYPALTSASTGYASMPLTAAEQTLTNAQILRHLEREARHAGCLLPQVCTPLELMGDLPYESESSA
jgi:hypothetical protein